MRRNAKAMITTGKVSRGQWRRGGGLTTLVLWERAVAVLGMTAGANIPPGIGMICMTTGMDTMAVITIETNSSAKLNSGQVHVVLPFVERLAPLGRPHTGNPLLTGGRNRRKMTAVGTNMDEEQRPQCGWMHVVCEQCTQRRCRGKARTTSWSVQTLELPNDASIMQWLPRQEKTKKIHTEAAPKANAKAKAKARARLATGTPIQ